MRATQEMGLSKPSGEKPTYEDFSNLYRCFPDFDFGNNDDYVMNFTMFQRLLEPILVLHISFILFTIYG